MAMLMVLFSACLASNNSSSAESGQMGADPLQAILAGGDPMGSLHGMLGDLGLQGQEPLSDDVPHYKPPSGSARDVAILITGCQAHETSVSQERQYILELLTCCFIVI